MISLRTSDGCAPSRDRHLRAILPWFFLLVFITTIVAAFNGYLKYNQWEIGDWLINYQGGWVRRGLLGEAVLRLVRGTQINPGIYVVILQGACYALFMVFSWRLLLKQNSLRPYLLLIFSPFIFTFQLNTLHGGFRKEILFFAVFAALVWAAKSCTPKVFETFFFAVLLFYPVLILSHEMLAVLLPYLVVVYASTVALTKRRRIALSVLLLPSLASFVASLCISADTAQVQAIFDSLAEAGYPLTGGAISWLDKSTGYGMARVADVVKDNQYLLYYPQVLLLALVAYIPIRVRFVAILRGRLTLLLCLASVCGSLLLFVVALDWGRFMYMHFVAWFLLSFLDDPSAIPNRHVVDRSPGLRCLIAAGGLVYALSWHIPHCCLPFPYPHSWKQLNLFAFVWPYQELFKIFW